MLHDRKIKLSLGDLWPYVTLMLDSRRGPVENGGTMLDLSGRGNHAALDTGNSTVTPGEGLDCGNESQGWGATVADDDGLSFENGTTDVPFGIFLWHYNTGLAVTQQLFAKRQDAGSPNIEWNMVQESGGVINMTLFDGANNQRIGAKSASGTSNSNAWNFYGATYNGNGAYTDITLYHNGQAVATVGNNNAGTYYKMDNTGSTVQIGYYGANPTAIPTVGKIDGIIVVKGIEPSAQSINALFQVQRPLFGV